MTTGVTGPLRDLLGRLVPFIVTSWGTGSQTPVLGLDRQAGDLAEASVISSKIKPEHVQRAGLNLDLDFLTESPDFPHGYARAGEDRHMVVLDIDWPAHLVESSTPGHSHLYIEVPNGIPAPLYFDLLDALQRAGVIEEGYSEVSQKRGHTDVRLPWVSKADANQAASLHVACIRCGEFPSEIGEYVDMATDERDQREPHLAGQPVSAAVVIDWVRRNEGTYNPETGRFACTNCYIAMGQPSGGPAGRWTA